MDVVVMGPVRMQYVHVKRDTKDLVVKNVRNVQWWVGRSMEKNVDFMVHVIVESVNVKKDMKVNHV